MKGVTLAMGDTFQQNDVVKVWDDVAAGYNLQEYWTNEVHQSWFGTLSSLIGSPAGKSLLEVGCGSGFQSLRFAENGADVSLLDLSPRAIEIARNAFVTKKQPLPRCYVCDALYSEIPDDSFDVVWNMGVIEHFSDEGKSRLLSEMVRMTKPNGKTIVMVPNSRCWPFQVGQIYQKLRGIWPYGKEDDMSPIRLRRLAANIGIPECQVFAFDPISGWYWLPVIGSRLKKWFGPKSAALHMQRSKCGWMSVLVICKTSDGLVNTVGGIESGGGTRQ